MNTALILDDEELARKNLQGLLQKHCPQIDTIFSAATVAEAASVLENNNVHLLFLDIHLGAEKSFGLSRYIDPEKHAVVFVTAYEQYALPAIKLHPLDYLLKPVSIDELVAVVAKAGRYMYRPNAPVLPAQTPVRPPAVPDAGDNDKLVIAHWSGFDIIDAQKIIFAEADGNYTIFHLEGYRKIVSSKPVGYYEELLNPAQFFRAHKSYIINLGYLTGYSSREGNAAHMAEGYKVTISRRKLPGFLELCKKKQV